MSGLRAVGLGTMWKLDSERAYAYETTAATSAGAQRALEEEGVGLPGPRAAGGSRRRGVAAARGRQAARAAGAAARAREPCPLARPADRRALGGRAAGDGGAEPAGVRVAAAQATAVRHAADAA